jgi:hypothetical protein
MSVDEYRRSKAEEAMRKEAEEKVKQEQLEDGEVEDSDEELNIVYLATADKEEKTGYK